MTYELTWSRQAQRAIQHDLPEQVAIACLELDLGPLRENPHRVGNALQAPLDGLFAARRGEFRTVYDIGEGRVRVHLIDIRHRRDVYRSR